MAARHSQASEVCSNILHKATFARSNPLEAETLPPTVKISEAQRQNHLLLGLMAGALDSHNSAGVVASRTTTGGLHYRRLALAGPTQKALQKPPKALQTTSDFRHFQGRRFLAKAPGPGTRRTQAAWIPSQGACFERKNEEKCGDPRALSVHSP